MAKTKIALLYERLSRDDELSGESFSIQNQKIMLEDFARRNGYPRFKHFTDDGVSGTRFDRPGFMAMMEEVEDGNVEAIIIKDISIGTFYTLYPTKEDLFLETITDIQRRLTEKIIDINRNSRTKEGFAQSMKRLFREYDSKPFLYNVNTPDFQSFVTKLPEETIKKIKFDSFDFFRQVIHAADLNLKMEEAQAYGILSALLSTINAKETLSVTCDYFAVFDFMVDSLVADIFE